MLKPQIHLSDSAMAAHDYEEGNVDVYLLSNDIGIVAGLGLECTVIGPEVD